jgi:periplasmic protein CpxP/Spy
MTQQKLKLPAFLIATTLVFIGGAQAENAPPPSSPADKASGPDSCPWKHGDRKKHFEEKLNTLHEALKLSPAQEKSWQNWSSHLLKAKDQWKEDHAEGQEPAIKAVERLERKLAHLQQKQKFLQEQIVETKLFYGTLTSAQQKIFDTEFETFGKHPHRDQPSQ